MEYLKSSDASMFISVLIKSTFFSFEDSNEVTVHCSRMYEHSSD